MIPSSPVRGYFTTAIRRRRRRDRRFSQLRGLSASVSHAYERLLTDRRLAAAFVPLRVAWASCSAVGVSARCAPLRWFCPLLV